MDMKNIIIWGAGRIGRGFIGDLFNSENYQITFVDAVWELVKALEENGEYRVVRAFSEDNVEEVDISGYSILHPSQRGEIQQVINKANIMAISVYPQKFGAVADQLREHLLQRRKTTDEPMDILLCTNLIHAGPKFADYLYKGLDNPEKEELEVKTGIVETLVIRICPDPPDDVRKEHPLVVWTNGYSQLPVDKYGFKGKIPEVQALRIVEDMRAEEIRKIYTYNMCHAVLSFHGHMVGHKLLVDCLADERIRKEAEGALDEVSRALQKKYKFTQKEMDEWIDGVIKHTNNPTIGDTVARSAADPIRKLKRDDRLIGPALLCQDNGIEPHYLIRAAAAAFHYREEDDETSKKLGKSVQQKGIRKTVADVGGLDDKEEELIDQIIAEYHRLPEDLKWNEMAEEAFRLGFEYEKIYHGCGQCVIAAATEVLGIFDEEVFNSATGLCGGVGLVNDATCSAFTGGAMVISMLYPRHREKFDGDRDNKYIAFDLVQQLREKFLEKYGTIACGQIHKMLYGRPYDLRRKEERETFEEAGGHGDHGCTEVVADAAKWTVQILGDQRRRI